MVANNEQAVQVAPTITTDSPAVYSQRFDDFTKWARIIHIDICDGTLTSSKTISLNQVYLPSGHGVTRRTAIHLMSREFSKWANQLASLRPETVFIHVDPRQIAVALKFFDFIRSMGIDCGVVIGADDNVDVLSNVIASIDSVLLFGGRLGYQGGQADLRVLGLIDQIKSINPAINIEYDGGANTDNIRQIADAGVSVVNVGAAISNTDDPAKAYQTLTELANVS